MYIVIYNCHGNYCNVYCFSHAQYTVLSSLRGVTRLGNSPSQRELAGHTGLDPIYISKLERALEETGLIERVPDVNDTRAVRLTITKEGISVIDRAIVIVRDLLEQLTAVLGGTSSKRMQTLMSDLETLIALPSNSDKGNHESKGEIA